MKKRITRFLCALLTVATLISALSAVVFALPEFEDDFGAFLEKLGYYESRNTYNIKNEYGYLGRWQMGHLALQDVGFMTDSTHYSSLAASYGVYSDEDFLNSPEAQDYCIQALCKKTWSYIRYYGDDQYLGQTMWDIRITISGMIAAAHLVGVGALHNMLKSGVVATDANGATATFYLRELGGYNISKSLNTTITDPVVDPDPQPTEAKIHLFENYSATNYLLGTDFSSSIDSSYLKSRDTSVYSLSIDKTNAYENQNSLKITASSAGSATKDLYWMTQTSCGTSSGYQGDSITLTLSFYAKASVTGAQMYWRFGYGSEYSALSLTTSWKKYSLTITKKPSDGNVLHPYFSKAGTFYLNNVTLVDGTSAATLTTHETKTSQFAAVTGTIGKTWTSLPTPTRSGYTFDGWYTKKSGGAAITSSSIVHTGDINAYAHWTKITSYIPVVCASYNNHYYSVFNDDLTWSQARTACEKMGGHLVTIGGANENNFVKSLISSQSKGLYWIGAKLTDSGWSWVNGESFTYTNWATGQPSGGENYCEMLSRPTQSSGAGQWNDSNATSSEISYFGIKNIGYVCEFEADAFSSKDYYYNGNLYRVFDSRISWENAKALGTYSSGHLVTIGSSAENEYVQSIAKKSTASSYWIGLSNVGDSGTFSWVTGESLSYKNWSSGNPSNSNGIEKYVELTTDGKWNDVKNIGRDSSKTGCIIEYDNYDLAVQSITVVTKPTKVNYVQGEKFDASGLVVRANFEYGVTKNITDYTLSGYDSNALGVQKITVAYKGKTAQFSVYTSKKTVPVSSVSLSTTLLSLTKGETASLYASVYPEDASNKSVTWSSDNVNVATVSSAGAVTAKSAGSATVTVRTADGSYTAKCLVTVKDSAPTKLPKALVIVSKPKKTTYELGEDLDLTGMVINVKYDDGSTKEITNKCDVLGFDSSAPQQQKITLTYSESGKVVTVSFTVFIDREVKNLYVTSKPNKTTYIKGEQFERAGLAVVATFTDGSSKDVTGSIQTTGFTTAVVGVNSMTVSYTYRGKTVSTAFSIIIKPKLTGITVTSKPAKYIYVMGESFERNGMVITGSFSDGTTRDVTSDCKTAGFDTSSPGVKTMSVTYSYATQSFTRTFSIVIRPRMTGLRISSKPSKLSYKLNEPLNTSGMKIIATYWDGSEKNVTDLVTLTGFDSSVSGKQYLTVTYSYATVTLSRQFSVIIS